MDVQKYGEWRLVSLLARQDTPAICYIIQTVTRYVLVSNCDPLTHEQVHQIQEYQ